MTTLEQIETVYISLKKINDLIQVSEKRHTDEKVAIIKGFADRALKEAEKLTECQQIIAAIEVVFTPVTAPVTHTDCGTVTPVVSGKVQTENTFVAGTVLGKW